MAAVPLVCLLVSAGILVLVGVMWITPWKSELLANRRDFGPSSGWILQYSPGLVQNGVEAWTELGCVTGSGFEPACYSLYLPGNNGRNAAGEVYIFQRILPPDAIDNYEFYVRLRGLRGMTGVGNNFQVALCSSSLGCEETPEQTIMLNLFRCIPGDDRCILSNGTHEPNWKARLSLSTDHGIAMRMDETVVENLTSVRINFLKVFLDGENQHAQAEHSDGQPGIQAKLEIHYILYDPVLGISSVGIWPHYLNLYNTTFDISKLNVAKIGYTSACEDCNSTYHGSYAHVDYSSYTATASIFNTLHLNGLPALLFLAVAAGTPAVMAIISVWISKTTRAGSSLPQNSATIKVLRTCPKAGFPTPISPSYAHSVDTRTGGEESSLDADKHPQSAGCRGRKTGR